MTMANGLDKVSFLSGASGAFIENLHARFKENPQAVDFGWQQFFAELGDEAEAVEPAARAGAGAGCLPSKTASYRPGRRPAASKAGRRRSIPSGR